METLFTSPVQSPPSVNNDQLSTQHNDLISTQHTDQSNAKYIEQPVDQYSGVEKTPSNQTQNPSYPSNQPSNQYSSMKPPMKSSIPNHLKPNTIWHTAALPREDQPLDLRNEYDSIPIKKRRLEGGIEIVRCQICCQHFDSPSHLIDHLMEHDSDYKYAPIYKCSYGQCNYRTDDRPSMKYHISHVHIKTNQMRVSKKYRNRKLLRPTILCSTCPMVFATEKELWDHTASCKDYRCQFCGQHFWTIEKRLAHEDMYHEGDSEEGEGQEEEADASESVTHLTESSQITHHHDALLTSASESLPTQTHLTVDAEGPGAPLMPHLIE